MNYSVNLSSGQTVEVVIGEAAQINVEQALNYIESGRVEITKYVNEWAKPEITNYTNEYAKPIVTEIVNQTTKPLIDDYLNTTTKPQIDEYVADNVKPYADSAQDSAAKAKISKDNAKTSETNAKASELAAASSAGNAVQSANDSKLWAVGTKTEKPEGSSKYWAEQAKNAVQTPDATETVKGIVRLATSEEVTAGTNDSAAITPLKLKQKLDSKQYESTAVNYNNISNCITEIPQDIKLELNNDILTLKAGSKVYIPNGPSIFDTFICPNDLIIESSSILNSSQRMILIDTVNYSFVYRYLIEETYSGRNPPIVSSVNAVWYDTQNNIIKRTNDSGNTWIESRNSLPICIYTRELNKGVTLIDQVFNGFGYIGSTVFVLPGVKGLIPNGRNEDGSLKNIEFVNDRVKTFISSGSGYGLTYFLSPNKTNLAAVNTKAYAEKDTKLTTFDNNYGVWFDTKRNIMLQTYNSGATWTRVNYVSFFCMFMTNAGHLDYLKSKTVFHALDYNDKSTISGWSMPSSRYIDLTFGASDSTYTAPANGWFAFARRASAVGQFFNVTYISPAKITFWSDVGAGGVGNILGHLIPVQKGQIVSISYNAGGDIIECRFIYAEGENV